MRENVQHELAVAVEAARRAGRVILDHYGKFTAIPDARADISTQADRDSQETILRYLHDSFPNDGLCAEEITPALSLAPAGPRRVWIVDPIDGTRGFARKNGEFSVMIALMNAGRILLGVVLEPVTNRLTYATESCGCWRRDGTELTAMRCRVRHTERLSDAVLTQSHSRTPSQQSTWAEALVPARIVETYSAGIKLALVARGEADLYLNTYSRVNDWDICAGQILVEEAGGKVTDRNGNQIRYGQGADQRSGLLASNGVLHDVALASLRKVAGEADKWRP
jgi:3'(2'), 5'-bisphosphate nucleotidase